MSYAELVKERAPLIHNITNQVVMNFTANGLYALGASPLMAHEQEEMTDIINIADALVLNIGTITEPVFQAMQVAGKKATENGIPIVLDPVGVGASDYRMRVVTHLLETLKVSLIRGNAAEIMTLVSRKQAGKGVEGDIETDVAAVARAFYQRYHIPVVVTGKADIIYNGQMLYQLKNGSPVLKQVTGTGCLLTSVIAAFLAVADDEHYIEAATEAVSFYTVASEVAAEKTKLPGSFQVQFIDELAALTVSEWEKRAMIEVMG